MFENKSKNENEVGKSENFRRVKVPFLLSDVVVAIIAFVPLLNFITPIFLVIRYFKYRVVSKNYCDEIPDLLTLENKKIQAVSDLENLKSEYKDLLKKFEDNNSELQAKYDKKEEDLKANNDKLQKEYTSKINDLKKEFEELLHKVTYEYVSHKDYSDVNSEEIKNEISLLKLKEKELLKNDGAFVITSAYPDSKSFRANIKQITKCYTAESSEILNKLTLNNVDASRERLIKSYQTTNQAFETDFVQISKDYLELKLDELNINYELLAKIQEEKEIKQEEREMLREEEKVRREIEREKEKIEKEERQFKNEVTKLMAYMNKTDNDVEKQLYIDKIKELEDKLNLLDKDKKSVLDREQNTRAGYVYIISNIGSFGENIYKIGMTRRLEPMDRINELSSASVPFVFDVHALIFSEDAPRLENILHEHFRNQAVNKVNFRKEFYNVDLNEVKKVVLENFNSTVNFTMAPQATEYRESLKIAEKF